MVRVWIGTLGHRDMGAIARGTSTMFGFVRPRVLSALSLWLVLAVVPVVESLREEQNGEGRVVLEYGQYTFPSSMAEKRIVSYLSEFSGGHLEVIKEGSRLSRQVNEKLPVVLHLSIGLTDRCDAGAEAELALSADAYHLCGGDRSVEVGGEVFDDVPFLSAFGGASALTESKKGTGSDTCERGNLYAAYALLEHLGFGFLKAFQPIRASLSLENFKAEAFGRGDGGSLSKSLSETHSPSKRIRQWHYHTQHPLELVDVLQGWGQGGYGDEYSAGFTKMLSQVEDLFEWTIANRQNRFQYALLAAESWKDFARSPLRAERLTQIVDIAHNYCLAIGYDAPIVFKQQHAFALLPTTTGTPEAQAKMLQQNIDFLAGTGIDFLGTESGLSEFHKPSCSEMLRWMNETAIYADQAHGLTVSIKVHCSTAQTCPEFNDLNFNFLPELATTKMGVSPHTVQFYELDDPAPGVYGNSNFTYIKNWMFRMMEEKDREVLYYPETAYWCSFDSSVPLFLPLYARARFVDLRTIAKFEADSGNELAGQSNFDSGFEWGAWFNSVVTARSAFDHGDIMQNDTEAFAPQVTKFVSQFIMKTNLDAHAFSECLAKIIEAQYETMIIGNQTTCRGRFGNCTAISYITGYNMYTDIGRMSSELTVSVTRIPLSRVWRVSETNYYTETVKPTLEILLASLVTEHNKLKNLADRVRPEAVFLYEEVLDSIMITILRTRQVTSLYSFIIQREHEHLLNARSAISAARAVIKRREECYGVSQYQVNSWSTNPTVYRYRYLWTVKTLFYWERDEAIAIKVYRGDRFISPCFRNVENALQELNQFWGIDVIDSITQTLRNVFHNVPLINLATDCLNAPIEEPMF